MKIAVISDIHENFHNLFLALDEMEKRDVAQILCLGDPMNPGVVKILAAKEKHNKSLEIGMELNHQIYFGRS